MMNSLIVPMKASNAVIARIGARRGTLSGEFSGTVFAGNRPETLRLSQARRPSIPRARGVATYRPYREAGFAPFARASLSPARMERSSCWVLPNWPRWVVSPPAPPPEVPLK